MQSAFVRGSTPVTDFLAGVRAGSVAVLFLPSTSSSTIPGISCFYKALTLHIALNTETDHDEESSHQIENKLTNFGEGGRGDFGVISRY